MFACYYVLVFRYYELASRNNELAFLYCELVSRNNKLVSLYYELASRYCFGI